MKARTVLGVDPGTHSLGLAVLENGKLVSGFSVETRKSQRAKTPDETERWLRILSNALADAAPDVVAIEDIEHQPWRTNGKTPKGITGLQKLVGAMRDMCEFRGHVVYMQSPAIQADYPDTVLGVMARHAMGEDFDIQPHFLSALAHALFADAKLEQVRRRIEGVE